MHHHALIDTAFGPVGLAWSERGIVRLQLSDRDAEATRARLTRHLDSIEARLPDWLVPRIAALQCYFAGVPTNLAQTPIDLDGVPTFHTGLYREMLKLDWGASITYGELAARVGAPGAAQSVGRAMGMNPIPVIIPCHRVLASGNRMGGFSAPGGTRTKQRLLDMEGIRLGDRAQLAFAF